VGMTHRMGPPPPIPHVATKPQTVSTIDVHDGPSTALAIEGCDVFRVAYTKGAKLRGIRAANPPIFPNFPMLLLFVS